MQIGPIECFLESNENLASNFFDAEQDEKPWIGHSLKYKSNIHGKEKLPNILASLKNDDKAE